MCPHFYIHFTANSHQDSVALAETDLVTSGIVQNRQTESPDLDRVGLLRQKHRDNLTGRDTRVLFSVHRKVTQIASQI